MRWWWFGPAVEKTELARELRLMKDAGLGGVEIQPVYPLALDGNVPYLSPPFLDALQFAATEARSLGLQVGITLGSGWPYGGPHTSITRAAGQLQVKRIGVAEGTRSVPLPSLENGEQLIAAFLGGRQVTSFPHGRVPIDDGLSGPDALQLFISGRTGQQVKRPAIGAEGFVLDHYDPAAMSAHLASVAEPLLKAFGDHPRQSVFSDSLEVFGSDWTPNFLAEFRQRRGYDLTPYLPALADAIHPNSLAIRHDWAKTLTELLEANYLEPIRRWAHAHGTLFRSQTYGEPPAILSSNALVDLPEGEHGPSWRRFSAARWASSANHLYGRPITSTETWTWLHSPAFRATPLDLKAEADRHFVEGINQLVGHGWPYSPSADPRVREPGYRFYAAAALNEHNPWFPVMPDIARYLQRVSFLLRQGQPDNDIGIYVPTDDAWAHLEPGKVALDEMCDTLLGPTLIPAVLNAGYNFDFIDDRAMAAVGIPYKILILPAIERMPLATLHLLEQYIKSGGHVVATRTLPSLAPGLQDAKQTPKIAQLARSLFQPVDEQLLLQTLHGLLPPDFAVSPEAAPSIGFIHRHLPFAEVYFVANMSNRTLETGFAARATDLLPECWDPLTVETTKCRLPLAPYQSRVFVFSKDAKPAAGELKSVSSTSVHLANDWQLDFPTLHRRIELARLRSWTDDESTRFFSGEAIYRKRIELAASFVNGKTLTLDFGPGTPVEPVTDSPAGMRALLESPARETASVTVNDRFAGHVWCPPYELDITRFLHPGRNQLSITVRNLAINEMAGQALPDYRLLNLRFGERFVPQGFEERKPLPAGLLGAVRLVAK